MSQVHSKSVAYFGVDYTSLSVSWLGNWSESWGPYEVYSWDTSQGIARNLANNLKWSFTSDASAKCSVPKVKAGSCRSFGTSANAFVTFNKSRAYSGIGVWSLRVSANGFARMLRSGAKTYSRIYASGNGFAKISMGYRARIYSGIYSPTGAATVKMAPSVIKLKAKMLYTAKGVRNPSDEVLSTLAINLLTSKQKRATFSQL